MLAVSVAWRNLWRNKRRTFLTAGAIAFAVLLIQVGMSFQVGSYEPMIEMSTRFGSGHLQVQHHQYQEHPRTERVVAAASGLRTQLLAVEGVVAVSNRCETYGIVSKEEKSYGALIVGVDPLVEKDTSYFSNRLIKGVYLEDTNSAYIGSALARNLNVTIGDEIVILSSDTQGSVAFAAPQVTGIFELGNDALDRALVQVHHKLLDDVLGLNDSTHRVVIMTEDPLRPERLKAQIEPMISADAKVLDWQELMPEISQSIRLDKISNGIVYGTLTLIVVLSIANTFVMSMFERTREFGMLRAVGMRTNAVFAMFLVETILLWLVGVAIGFLLSACVILPLAKIGIGMDSMGIEEMSGMLIFPDRIHPGIDLKVVLVAPLSIGVGMALSTALASIRLYRLSLTAALRYKE